MTRENDIARLQEYGIIFDATQVHEFGDRRVAKLAEYAPHLMLLLKPEDMKDLLDLPSTLTKDGVVYICEQANAYMREMFDRDLYSRIVSMRQLCDQLVKILARPVVELISAVEGLNLSPTGVDTTPPDA